MIRDPLNWTPPPPPTNDPMAGQYIDIVAWDADAHGQSLWQSFGEARTNQLLFHFSWPQMNKWEDLAAQLNRQNRDNGFRTCIFVEKGTGVALGMASYMSIVPEHGRVETGAIAHGQKLRGSRASTEAHYLMASRVFDELGYRRYEWKLNNPNQASHRAAQRLGFTFEGVFRQHQVMTYGNRDTAWYSLLDNEWPSAKAALEKWLDRSNFNEKGEQIMRLEEIREASP